MSTCSWEWWNAIAWAHLRSQDFRVALRDHLLAPRTDPHPGIRIAAMLVLQDWYSDYAANVQRDLEAVADALRDREHTLQCVADLEHAATRLLRAPVRVADAELLAHTWATLRWTCQGHQLNFRPVEGRPGTFILPCWNMVMPIVHVAKWPLEPPKPGTVRG